MAHRKGQGSFSIVEHMSSKADPAFLQTVGSNNISPLSVFSFCCLLLVLLLFFAIMLLTMTVKREILLELTVVAKRVEL